MKQNVKIMKKRTLAVVALGCLVLAGCGSEPLGQAGDGTDPDTCAKQANALIEATQDSIDVTYTRHEGGILGWLTRVITSGTDMKDRNQVCEATVIYARDLGEFDPQMSEYLYKIESVQDNEDGTCNYREDDEVKSAPCELRKIQGSSAEEAIREALSPKATPNTVDEVIQYGSYYHIGDLKIADTSK